MASDSRWQSVVEKAEALQDRVEKMEEGGDLEGLIEDGLEGIILEMYEQLLAARERAASAEAAAFSPSAMSSVRGGGASQSGSTKTPANPDAARGGAV